MADVVVIGAGHNGLVAATLLAGSGLAVEVLERDSVIGGACRTETPFARAPHLRASTGAYLLGLMPPELIRLLDLDLPLIRRDPHSFLPMRDGRFLLLGGDAAEARRQLEAFLRCRGRRCCRPAQCRDERLARGSGTRLARTAMFARRSGRPLHAPGIAQRVGRLSAGLGDGLPPALRLCLRGDYRHARRHRRHAGTDRLTLVSRLRT